MKKYTKKININIYAKFAPLDKKMGEKASRPSLWCLKRQQKKIK